MAPEAAARVDPAIDREPRAQVLDRSTVVAALGFLLVAAWCLRAVLPAPASLLPVARSCVSPSSTSRWCCRS
jgi:hypothetical protein